jgi:hypothetical protein
MSDTHADTETRPNKIGTGSYVVAGLGFIPAIGVVFAIIAIILGVVKRKNGGRRLIVLGCLGIGLSVVIYSALFYEGFVVRGGIYDKLRVELAKKTIVDLVKNIEYYKLVKGEYPASLSELEADLGKESRGAVYDPSAIIRPFSGQDLPKFFYQLTDDKSHYYLLGVGADQKPFTDDDLIPNLSDQARAKTGLVIKPSSLSVK